MALTRAQLNNHKATFKKVGSGLLNDIQRHVQRKPTDVELGRDVHHVHPSEMAKPNWCHRHTYYRCIDTPAEQPPEKYSFRVLNAFHNGHDAHHKYQGWLEEMGVLWGRWWCPECGTSRFGAAQPVCDHCHRVKEEYREVPFESVRYHMWGHADGIVEQGEDFLLVEVKTLGEGTLRFEAPALFDAIQQKLKTPAEAWNSITRPFPSHLIQGQIYLRLLRECYPDLPPVRTIVFIYEWRWTNEAKEFVVTYTPEFSQSFFDRALEVAVGVRTNGEVMPSRPDWADIDSGFCQACDYYKTCYSIGTTTNVESPKPRRAITVQKTTSAKRRKSLG